MFVRVHGQFVCKMVDRRMCTNSQVEVLLTAEEFGRMPDDGTCQELVRGRIVCSPFPFPYEGYVCAQIIGSMGQFVEQGSLGAVLGNIGIITERDPDTVRAGDVCFFRKHRLPAELPRDRYLDIVPDLVVEVRSPSDRWRKVLAKVSEYLTAGVSVVIVADIKSDSVLVYR
jgi:Uma2 family endonuclease